MLRNPKILLTSLFSLFFIFMIGGICLYVYGHKHLDAKITQIEEDLRQKGYTVSYSKRVFSRNPFNLYATIENPTFKDSRGMWEWKGQEVTVSLKLWAPYTLKCSFDGDQRLNIPHNSLFHLGTLQFEGATGDIILTSKGILDEVNFNVDHLVSWIGAKKQPYSLKSMTLKATNLSQPLHMQLSFKTMIQGLDTLVKKTSNEQDVQIELDTSLSGYQNTTPPKTLAEWKDGGGILDINVLKINWPPIVLEANGTLTLDKEMYPLGSFTSSIKGYQDALSYMVELGWVKNKNASAVLFVMDLLSKSDETGNKKLTVPVTFQNKRLSIGPASLLKLQPIEEF